MARGSATSGSTAWYATFDFPPSHPDDDVRVWLATVMMPTHEVWVATEPDGRVVAFLALSDDMIDQLYVTPDRIGTGIGSRLIATAKARRPDGLDLYCFQANTRARTFYEHHGFVAAVYRRRVQQLGGPAGHPLRVATGSVSPAAPSLVVRSRDDTPIAVFSSGEGPPLVLVHGATADHTAFRVVGPMLGAIVHGPRDRPARSRGVGRRGRPVFDRARVRGRRGGRRDAGGRVRRAGRRVRALVRRALRARRGAADRRDPASHLVRGSADAARVELSPARHRGPTPGAAGGRRQRRRARHVPERGRRDERGRPCRLPGRPDLAGSRRRGGHDPARARGRGGAGRLARPAGRASRQPVLQLLGGESLPVFRDATVALDARLADGRIVVIDGARHAAHHTHPDQVVQAVEAFLA